MGARWRQQSIAMTRRILRVVCVLALVGCSPRTVFVGRDDTPPIGLDAGRLVIVPAPDASEPMLDASVTAPMVDAAILAPIADAAPRDAAPVDAAATDAEPMAEPDAEPTPPRCTGSNADCDGDPRNGCEANLNEDSAHCGSCATACRYPDCACRAGKLTVVCPPGHADCDGDRRNGCEVDTDTSMQNCGACNKLCHQNGLDAVSATCMGGHCQITCRFEPFEPFKQADCDDNPDTGCETDLLTDNQNCGMCGMRCSCFQGMCL